VGFDGNRGQTKRANFDCGGSSRRRYRVPAGCAQFCNEYAVFGKQVGNPRVSKGANFGIEMNNGKICISVCAETADELIEQIKRAEDLADVIEIRFDCLKESEFDSALQNLSDLKCAKFFLATSRPKSKLAEFFFGKIIDEEFKQKKIAAFRERTNLWEKILSLKNID
jgi:hypothetical protein